MNEKKISQKVKFQKKYNLPKEYGEVWEKDNWIEVEKRDVARNIMKHKKNEKEMDKVINQLKRGHEVKLGLFKFRVLKILDWDRVDYDTALELNK